MTIVNYIIDDNLVNKLTTNRKWLDSYMPAMVKCVEKQGFDVVFDKDLDFGVRLGREVRRSAVKHHDINRTSRSLAGIYKELLGYHDHSCENKNR